MKREKPKKHNEPTPEEFFEAEVRAADVPSRHAFMGHDFLRRNLLVLLPPVIKPATRPFN